MRQSDFSLTSGDILKNSLLSSLWFLIADICSKNRYVQGRRENSGRWISSISESKKTIQAYRGNAHHKYVLCYIFHSQTLHIKLSSSHHCLERLCLQTYIYSRVKLKVRDSGLLSVKPITGVKAEKHGRSGGSDGNGWGFRLLMECFDR